MSAETVVGGASYSAEPTWPLPVLLRRVLLLVPPVLLAGLEVVHPQPRMNVQALMDVSTWFATFHAVQLALIGLVAVSVLLLADRFRRATAWATRIGVGMFLVFFSAYDTLAGIGTGLAMLSARTLSAAQQEGVCHRQGLAGPGCAVRTQHPRHCRVGSCSRCARASRSAASSSTTRVDTAGVRGGVPAWWASVSVGNFSLRLPLHCGVASRIEGRSNRCRAVA
jgi:hypothetical protein